MKTLNELIAELQEYQKQGKGDWQVKNSEDGLFLNPRNKNLTGENMDKSTGRYDKNDKLIYDGDKLYGKTIDGNYATFTVRWSDYRHDWIGDCPDEIYDISSSIFNQYEVNKIII